ncbi:DUF1563 domain-containing protein [Flavobacterium phragmitis]
MTLSVVSLFLKQIFLDKLQDIIIPRFRNQISPKTFQ